MRGELDTARARGSMRCMGVATTTKPDEPAGPSSDLLHIIAIIYRSEDSIGGFLDCLAAQTFQAWRLIAVDNDSRDRSRDVMAAKPDPRITLLRNARNEGFARAVNKGLAHGLAEGATRFLIINDDTAFDPDFLARLVARWTESGAPVVAPRVMFLHAPGEAWYAGARFDDGWLFTHQPDRFDPEDTRPARQVEFAPGCCLAFGADVIRRIGFFDESFFVYWEDADFCMRLKAACIPLLYLRDPSLLHAAGASSGGQFSISYIRLYYTSYMQFLRKHFGVLRALRSAFRIALKEVSRPGRDRAKVAATIRAMLAGLVAPLRPEKRADKHPATGHSGRKDPPTG